jgi:hypothetical protein
VKIGHMVGVASVAYLALTGINNFLPNANIPLIDSLPDLGQTVTGNVPGSNTANGSSAGLASPIAGIIDLVAAGAVYYFFLHGKL